MNTTKPFAVTAYSSATLEPIGNPITGTGTADKVAALRSLQSDYPASFASQGVGYTTVAGLAQLVAKRAKLAQRKADNVAQSEREENIKASNTSARHAVFIR